MEKLRDIKPLVEIPDFSFYIYLFFILLATLLAALFIYWIIKKIGQKRVDERKAILAELQSLDLSDAKRVAYTITKKGKILVKDSSTLKIYQELLRRLARYKYKKEVPPLDEETKRYIKLFLNMGRDG